MFVLHITHRFNLEEKKNQPNKTPWYILAEFFRQNTAQEEI